MPPRTLATLAHALAVAPSQAHALRALGESLAELDRFAHLALLGVDARRTMLTRRWLATAHGAPDVAVETTLDHLPDAVRTGIAAGAQFIDFGADADDCARMLAMPSLNEPGMLAARGLIFDGQLAGVLVLLEPRKLFGARTSERLAPAIELFALAWQRVLEREAREEAVVALETVTERLHAEHARRLAELEARLRDATESASGSASTRRVIELEQALAASEQSTRKATRRAEAVEATVSAAVGELEKAHVELHRRNELLRQRTRTLYLLERLLGVADTLDDPRALAEGLLALVADDMHAHRCSLLLRDPGGQALFIAAARGVAPGVNPGDRLPLGQGVAGRVGASREPLLVLDVEHAREHPLLRDDHFTTGSFISFPLEYHGELVGVVNLANRAHRAVFVEEDMDRVRLLGLVIALVASTARLPERLAELLHGG